jgi:hypothetical protein
MERFPSSAHPRLGAARTCNTYVHCWRISVVGPDRLNPDHFLMGLEVGQNYVPSIRQLDAKEGTLGVEGVFQGMIGYPENVTSPDGRDYQKAGEYRYQPSPASDNGSPPDHQAIYLAALTVLLGTVCGCSGIWLLTFGIRGRDSAGSIIAAFGLLGGCGFFVWYGLSALLTPSPAFPARHLTSLNRRSENVRVAAMVV